MTLTPHDSTIHKAQPSSYINIPSITFTSNAVEVPSYTNYTSLGCNVLAENEDKLVVWPYFEDGAQPSEADLYAELQERYARGTARERIELLFRRHRGRAWRYATYNALAELGCTMDDVLRYLLEPVPDVDFSLSADVQKAWGDRHKYCDDENGFDRSSNWWVGVLSALGPSSGQALAYAAMACAAFHEAHGFNLWHLAKVHAGITEARNQALLPCLGKKDLFLSLTCRNCQLHDCPYHGAIEEFDETRSDANDLPSDEEDIPAVNHKKRVVSHLNATLSRDLGLELERSVKDLSDLADPLKSEVAGEQDMLVPSNVSRINDEELCSEGCFLGHSTTKLSEKPWSETDLKELHSLALVYQGGARTACLVAPIFQRCCKEVHARLDPSNMSKPVRETKPPKRDWRYWLIHTKKSSLNHERAPFFPCQHAGSCEDARCRCYLDEITCEKTCSCAKTCSRRYQGCTCARMGRICWHNKKCDCFRLNRECDPDLCGRCGAHEVLDPMNKHDVDIVNGRCANVGIQRNVPKHTLLGHSEVAGFGLFAGEAIHKHEYIGEYKGEVLSKEESDRRGSIYHYRSTNYLFKLNMGRRGKQKRQEFELP